MMASAVERMVRQCEYRVAVSRKSSSAAMKATAAASAAHSSKTVNDTIQCNICKILGVLKNRRVATSQHSLLEKSKQKI